MNFILSLLIGAITSVMIFINGTLSSAYGNFTATVLIHLIGLCGILLVSIIQKRKINRVTGIPIYLYSAGCIGVFTVLLTNLSYSKLGVSLTLSTGLLGQSVFSVLVDHYGLLDMKRVRFNPKKLWGFAIILAGIFIMAFL